MHVACFSRRLSLLAQIAAALEHLHLQDASKDKKPVLHNDLRAANVLLDFRGGKNGLEPIAKLSDFGLAKEIDDVTSAVELGKATNPMWAAPEAWWSQPVHEGERQHGAEAVLGGCRATLKSDVFSFGESGAALVQYCGWNGPVARPCLPV